MALSLLKGEAVTVLTPSVTYGAGNEPMTEWSRTDVQNVLIAPASTSDASDSVQPFGTKAALRFGFPKTFNAPLRGCRIAARGAVWSVIGDPQPNSPENCPTRWNYTADAERFDG